MMLNAKPKYARISLLPQMLYANKHYQHVQQMEQIVLQEEHASKP